MKYYHNFLAFSIFLLGLFLFTFFKIFSYNPDYFNPDTFQHLSIANSYLNFDQPIRDSYTVGPIISLVIFLFKITFGIDNDFLLLSLIVFIIYISNYIFIAFFSFRNNINIYLITNFYLIFLYFIPFEQDSLSLNGELLAVFFIICYFNFSHSPSFITHILFFTLVSYTKIQALPIIFFYYIYTNWLNRKLIYIIIVLTLFDILLFNFNLGHIFNFKSYLQYTLFNWSDSGSRPFEFYFFMNNIYISTKWLLLNLTSYYPYFYLLLGATIFLINFKSLVKLLIFIFISFLCIILPMKNFPHYLILLFPCIFIIAFDLITGLTNYLKNKFLLNFLNTSSILFCILFLVLINRHHIFNLYNNLDISFIRKNLFISNESQELFNKFKLPPDASLLVHCWDYRYYSLFDKGSPRIDYLSVYTGRVSKIQYENFVYLSKFDFILDCFQHTSLIKFYSPFPEYIINNYESVFNSNNLILYKYKR